MKIKTQHIRFFVVTTLVLTVFLTHWIVNVNTSLTGAQSCILKSNSCQINTGKLKIYTEFNRQPVPEEELTVSFSLNDDWEISKAWVEGVNMYMGKTPLMFENESAPNEAILFLGSCNLPQMEWQMFIEVNKKDTNETSVLFVSFVTDNSQL